MPEDGPGSKGLKRRIRFEEIAIKSADGLIASSEHEARVQYGMYRHHDPQKTRINPPGCDLNSFRTPAPQEVATEVDKELRRFLRQPDRPCLLAIARPVEKKNLCALVRAYGENPKLRKRANLVIFAGTRRNPAGEEPEARRVWDELIGLIDEYDLYGDVAYPRHHEFRHIPAIYQWAVRRRGIFVNPALHEPFGLTLLEAAAAGLPVVATREGGPVDIMRRCQHGLLVSPTDVQAIADACQSLLDDNMAWRRHSSNGRRNADFYSWSRHADQYIRDTEYSTRPVNQLLATDMDGTLLGNHDGLKQLTDWLSGNRQCLFVVATGRSIQDALSEMETWGAPLPDVLIADVGSAVYQFDGLGKPLLMEDWHHCLKKDWQRARCQRLLDAHTGLEQQPAQTQSAYKLSYFICKDRTGNAELAATEVVSEVEKCLATAGLAAQVVCSHDNLLDVLPLCGGKALAVEFIRDRYGINHQNVVTAGDSGNDLDLLRHAPFGIAVANHTAELTALQGLSNIYWAGTESAAGIMEGLHYSRRVTETEAGT